MVIQYNTYKGETLRHLIEFFMETSAKSVEKSVENLMKRHANQFKVEAAFRTVAVSENPKAAYLLFQPYNFLETAKELYLGKFSETKPFAGRSLDERRPILSICTFKTKY